MVKIGTNSTTPLPILCHSVNDFHPSGILTNGDNPLAYPFSLLIFHLILVIAITRTVRFLLKPLRQPVIISQIIGGMIIGPSVLGRSKWFQRHMMPATAQFLVNNLGVMGFMFFLFIYGVKMDPGLLRKSGRMHVSTAIFGILVPTMSVFSVALYMRKNMDAELATISSIGILTGYLGITAFPVLYNVLKELNLLNSDVGRTALSTAMIGDAFGVGTVVAFEAGKQGESRTENALWYMLCLFSLMAFILFCVRPAMVWINKKTPEGQPVDQSYVVAILLGVFVMGFITDMLGIAIANGPLWLGLAIPDGPRLGATLVNKSKTIMTEFLLPFSFVIVGSYTDIFAMVAADWSSLSPLFVMVLTGYLTKFFSTWIAAFYWRMPLRDGLTFSLIMSLRGQIELLLFVHLMDKRVLKPPGFTLLVLMTTALTATFTPLISILYDPTRPYIVNQRRNIQHNPPNAELRIVLCVLDAESINGLIHLLDLSNPTSTSPLLVSALRLIELEGRANPLLIDHEKQEVPQIYQWTNTINALERYQQHRGVFVKLQYFTAVAPKQSMFQDICELSLEQDASLIILPYKKMLSPNLQVLKHAPCSIAILVDKGLLEITPLGNSFRQCRYRFAVLFLGGADAREALVYADRLIDNQDVSLTVIRFLSHNYIGDDEMEKKLDDGTVTWFWVKNEVNQRVLYREVVVRDGEETIAAIQAMNDGGYDLLIVGRKQGINPVLLTGLSEWGENEELGLIGDYVSSEDFSGSASVLVVHQQILRG
ncbi:cation/H(+) antiporter 24 [Gastrolobium bilobum]|uniref:cation/H(+) antiporter 24 n=1 Tax=Gastrolobium bilobum TaxID=150636 RepID=UPI002AAF97A1|nr:cation/H(+) antiporter 24 [Gastrolobium bilobum]